MSTELKNHGVAATVNYLKPPTHVPLRLEVRPQGKGERTALAEDAYDSREVFIENARNKAPTVETHGMALESIQPTLMDYADVWLTEHYWPKIESLLKTWLPVSEARVFDHTLRISSISQQQALGQREPVRLVHNDYTPESGYQRAVDVLGQSVASRWATTGIGIINVWHSVAGVVQRTPLAVCDAQSMAPSDLIETQLIYPDRQGAIYHLTFSPTHQWCYFPAMAENEALLLKTYDSRPDATVAFTAHTAFDDPTTPSQAADRQSIELRVLVRYAG